MSVSGILSSSQYQPQHQLTNSQFQQLGSDLASGNLSSAQSDFATLQAAFAATGTTSSPSSASSTTSSNPLAAAFQQLSNDLQSGNITGAQRDYSTIKNDMQNQFSGHSHVGHHHGTGEDSILPISNPASQDHCFLRRSRPRKSRSKPIRRWSSNCNSCRGTRSPAERVQRGSPLC